MRIVLATSNKGKLKEFNESLNETIIPFSQLLGRVEIIENGKTFKENALIKATTIYQKLNENLYCYIR